MKSKDYITWAGKLMMYTYILQSLKDLSWYIGCTNDLRKRFEEHNTGRSKYTKEHAPYVLLYYEACLNKQDAFRREEYLKSGYVKKVVKEEIKERPYRLGT